MTEVEIAKGLSEAHTEWHCDRGNFWGTAAQLTCCARCGKREAKKPDEPRHFAHVFKPTLHMICDACFEALPE